ncbi:MAG: ChaN family lipoprotein [Alphaproteobacteria bacterium]
MRGLTRRHMLAAMAGAGAAAWLTGRGEAAEPTVPAWQSPHLRDHPLVGRFYAPGDASFPNEAAALDRLGAAKYVLLGETHDNPDHHRLQAHVIRALVERGRHPAVAFEMMVSTQRGALARHLAEAPKDAAGLGPAIGWEHSGWPPWRLYQPIAEVALEAELPIVPASFTPDAVRALGRGDPALQRLAIRLGLTEPLPGVLQASLEREISAAHCGYVEGEVVRAMARVQVVRDAGMARRLFDAAETNGAVLIAGTGHCRNDRGVPYHLRRIDGGAGVASLAFIEVSEDGPAPADYAAAFDPPGLPFDLVCFTPRVDSRDACQRFREKLKEMGDNASENASR